MNSRLRSSDWLLGGLLGIWSFFSFQSGRDDFSYDFGNYVAYFERIRDLSLEDIWAQLQAFFPYPYILVPPAGFFEVGFAVAVWSLLATGLDGETTYAIVGTLSIVARVLLMRSLGVGWLSTALATVYSVTLFEANAIRLGCALTATVGTLWAWKHGHRVLGTLLLALAASFHLQSLAYTLPLAVGLIVAPVLERGLLWRAAALAINLMAALALVYAPGISDFGKLNEYADTAAGSVGLNAASLSGLVALTLASALYLAGGNGKVGGTDQRLWSATHLAALPGLVLVLLATSMGALGDRVWQFAFIGAVAALPLARATAYNTGKRGTYNLYATALSLSLLIAAVNVTIRYPLSNFFVPFLPYAPITPATLIVL